MTEDDTIRRQNEKDVDREGGIRKEERRQGKMRQTNKGNAGRRGRKRRRLRLISSPKSSCII